MHGLAVFALVYLLGWVTPGPVIAAVVARVLTRGIHGVIPFVAGLVTGDLIWMTLAATGMSTLAQNAHSLFMAVKYAGALYLLFLAFRMWNATPHPVTAAIEADSSENAPRLFVSAMVLVLGNPKAMIFFLALLPTVVDMRAMNIGAYLQIAVAMSVISSGVVTLYALAAIRARRYFTNVRAIQRLNRGSGVLMAAAAVAVAARPSG